MIMRTLHSTQPFAAEWVGDHGALDLIHAMVADGTRVMTTDFYSPNREHVILFWTTDNAGNVATLWEYTMHFLPNVSPTREVREVMRTQYEVSDAELASRPGNEDTYAVGE